MLSIKPGVKLGGLTPQIVLAAFIVEAVYRNYKLECVITSGSDSGHGVDSLHTRDGLCRAFDFRTKHILPASLKIKIRDDIKAMLGENYDVIFEHEGEDNEHIHVEYDPKGVV